MQLHLDTDQDNTTMLQKVINRPINTTMVNIPTAVKTLLVPPTTNKNSHMESDRLCPALPPKAKSTPMAAMTPATNTTTMVITMLKATADKLTLMESPLKNTVQPLLQMQQEEDLPMPMKKYQEQPILVPTSTTNYNLEMNMIVTEQIIKATI